MGLETLVPLVVQGGVVALAMLMWWFERQDKMYERERRDIERAEFVKELKERDARLNDLAERGIINANATTVALTTIKDLIIQGSKQA